MTTSIDQLRELHKALHLACGVAALSPSMSDQSAWWAFLREMQPLDNPEAGGPLTAADITAVVSEMQRQNKAQQANWSLRPSKILRNPEDFRDMILMARKRRAARPRPPATQLVEQEVAGFRRIVEVDVHTEPTTAAEAIAILRKARASA